MGWEDELHDSDIEDRKYGVLSETYVGAGRTDVDSGFHSIYLSLRAIHKFPPYNADDWKTIDSLYSSMKALMENGELTDLNNKPFVDNGQKATDADVDRMFAEMQVGNVLLVNNPNSKTPERYHLKLAQPLFDKDTKELNESPHWEYSRYPISEKQHEMLKMSSKDAQKALDSLGDPPKKPEDLEAYNMKRQAYEGVIERINGLAAKEISPEVFGRVIKETVLDDIKKELNVDDEYFQKIQDMKQKERDRLQKPRRGFWGTVRDRLFGKDNAGRREYDKKVREYEDKDKKLEEEINESKKMIADAKKQIEDRFNDFVEGEYKDDIEKRRNEVYTAKAYAAIEQKFGKKYEYQEILLDEDIAKNYIKNGTFEKGTEVKENVEVSKETEVKGNEKVNEVKANDKLIKDEEQPSNHDIFFANSAVIQVMGKAVLQTMDDYVRKYDGNSPDNVAAGGKAIIDYIKNENNIEKPECERLIKTLALGNNAEFQKDSAKYSKFQKEYEALLANIGKTINEGKLAEKDGDDVIKGDTVVEQAIEKYLPGVKKTNDIPTNTENKKQVNWQKINNESKLDDNLTGFLK